MNNKRTRHSDGGGGDGRRKSGASGGSGSGGPPPKMTPEELFTHLLSSLSSDPVILPSHLIGACLEFEKDVGTPQERPLITVMVACAGAWTQKVSEYGVLLGGLMNKSHKTRKLASAIMHAVANEINTLRTAKERVLLRFLVASLMAGKATTLLKTYIQTMIMGIANQHDHELCLALTSVLPWLHGVMDASELETLLMSLSQCERAPIQEYALRVQADRSDPACDRVSLGLACLREDEGVAKFQAMLISCASQLPESNNDTMNNNEFNLAQSLQNLSSRLLLQPTFPRPKSNGHDMVVTTYLPLFPDGRARQEVSDDPRHSFAQRFILRETVGDILDGLYPHHVDAVLELARLDAPLVVVEVILSHMLSLPHAPHNNNTAYFADVLVDLCHIATLKDADPIAISQAFEHAVDEALDRLEDLTGNDALDLDVIQRVAAWMVHHLSSMGFKWSGWAKWENVVQQDRPMQDVVDQVLDRLDTLLPREELVNSILPAGLVSRLSPTSSSPPTFKSEFATPPDEGSTNPNHDAFLRLSTFLRSKPDGPTLVAWLENEVNQIPQIPHQQSRLLIHTALALGAASFTHMRAAIERIRPALIKLKVDCGSHSSSVEDPTAEFERSCLSDATSFWAESGLWAAFAVQCLTRNSTQEHHQAIVSDSTAVRWLINEWGGNGVLRGWRGLREVDDLLQKDARLPATTRQELWRVVGNMMESSTINPDPRLKAWLRRRATEPQQIS